MKWPTFGHFLNATSFFYNTWGYNGSNVKFVVFVRFFFLFLCRGPGYIGQGRLPAKFYPFWTLPHACLLACLAGCLSETWNPEAGAARV